MKMKTINTISTYEIPEEGIVEQVARIREKEKVKGIAVPENAATVMQYLAGEQELPWHHYKSSHLNSFEGDAEPRLVVADFPLGNLVGYMIFMKHGDMTFGDDAIRRLIPYYERNKDTKEGWKLDSLSNGSVKWPEDYSGVNWGKEGHKEVLGIQSLEPDRNIDTLLLETIQSQPNAGLITVISPETQVSFYAAQGFKQTGIKATDGKSELMTWRKR